jgi:hypothetical protein
MQNPVCHVKTSLFREYQTESEAYSAAVSKLTHKVAGASKIEYERLRFTAEQARKRTRRAKDELHAHTQEHGC